MNTDKLKRFLQDVPQAGSKMILDHWDTYTCSGSPLFLCDYLDFRNAILTLPEELKKFNAVLWQFLLTRGTESQKYWVDYPEAGRGILSNNHNTDFYEQLVRDHKQMLP